MDLQARRKEREIKRIIRRNGVTREVARFIHASRSGEAGDVKDVPETNLKSHDGYGDQRDCSWRGLT